MSKTLRLILFLTFVFAFLISAPLLVLYTAGYRFDLTHGRIVHTAVLNLTSEPRNATVSIDNEAYSDRTPAVIETILPGDHIVRLEKTGYLPWETALSFNSRDALVVGPIALFLDAKPQLQQSILSNKVIVHHLSERFAYVLQESTWLEVWMVETSTPEKKLLMRLPYVTSSTYDLTWSHSGTYLMLVEQHGDYLNTVISRVSDGVSIDIPTSLFNADATWWDIESDSIVYFSKAGTISQIDLATQNTQTTTSDVNLMTLYKDKLLSLSTNNNRTVVSYEEGTTSSIITFLPIGEYKFVESPDGMIALHETRRNRLILIDMENREQPILFNEDVLLWDWNQAQNTLLYSSGYDLKEYSSVTHEAHTLTRLSTQITHLAWYPIGTVVIYQTEGRTTALNLDKTTTLSQTILVENLSGLFWTDLDSKTLHILSTTENSTDWWSRQLQN